MDVKTDDAKYLANVYNRFDVTAQSGSGAVLKDENGGEYIDFSSGIGVNCLGYCDKGWVRAVERQLETLQHASNLYYTKPAVEAAKLLCRITGCDKTFFCNSGAEANEAAIKIARKASFDKYGEGRGTILTLKNSFHGRTLATLTATGQEVFHKYFYPFPSGFKYCEPNSDALEEAFGDDVCALVVEFVQGEGGVRGLSADFVGKAFELCRKKDAAFIADEVQTGAGRTGKFLASEHFCVKPDITTLAKGLGGGLPVGAALARGKYADTLGFSDHGTTFGANPVVCAGVCEVLKRVSDRGFLEEVEKKGEIIRKRLSECSEIADVSGLGMMTGIGLKTKKARETAEACIKNGLLVLTAKDRLRLLPPLNIARGELERGLDILIKTLGE